MQTPLNRPMHRPHNRFSIKKTKNYFTGILLCGLIFSAQISFAQSPVQSAILPLDTVPAIINHKAVGNGISFSSILRPLRPVAGAPEPFYTYFWEFGDGNFSFEKEPIHYYMDSLTYQVRLYATNSYDDGKRPPTRPKPLKPGASRPVLASTSGSPQIFKSGGSIEMKTNCMPKAGDDMMLVLGYRNKPENGLASLNGTISILYNDKEFNKDNFELSETRVYHNEKKISVDKNSNIAALKTNPADNPYYASLTGPNEPISDHTTLDVEGTALLKEKMAAYRKTESWKFENLKAGQEQFLFMNFKTTPEMIKDTNAVVHLTGMFVPENPLAATEFFTIELQIVASHDPNKMMLKNSRMNYRFTGKNKKLTYKIRFQNTGKGPAKKVDVSVAIPPNLNMASIQVTDSKPKLILCDSAYANQSCLDTIRTTDSVHFVFKNIYLPGLQQKGVNDADSTMGFVEYKIGFLEKPKKLPFKSGAAIVFDKNEPIYTNRSTGKYKMGLSPGIIAGYGFPFQSGNTPFKGQKSITLGASIAPYAPLRYFLQAELYMSSYAEKEYYIGRIPGNGRIITIDGKREARINYTDSAVKVKVVTINIVPAQLRYNFNKYFGAGVGTLVSFNLDKQVTPLHTIVLEANANGVATPDINESLKKIRSSFSDFQNSLFADIQVGKVQVGPAIGFRYFYTLQNNANRMVTYLTWKF